MNIIKKTFSVFVFLTLFFLANNALAMTPSLSLLADPNNSTSVTLNVSGDANASVTLYYYSTNASGPQVHYIGNTNSSGSLSISINLSDYNITQNSNITVSVNGQQSASVTWTYSSSVTSSNTLTLSQTSLTTRVGQSSTVTTSNNGTYYTYLASNTNPKIANFSISGNQITVNGLTSGQTTANFCLITPVASNLNCSSLYVVVQNSGTQSLTFSQNNTSIISGQNMQITITGGNGFYQVQNNSNSNIIGTSLNGPILTLYANGTTGSTTIAICSTDMNACGTVTASIGTYTSSGTGLSLSQAYPTITTGQTQIINISGGYGTYYISSNSNTNVVQTYLATSTITLYGNTTGNSTIIVCAPSGSCGTITASVVSSYGGAVTLSQSSLSLSTGQVSSVSITGGTTPYSIIQNNDGKAQYSLSGGTVTVTGISAGSSSATICSAGGACVTLTVAVVGASSTISGVQPAFSQNNLTINTNQTTAVSLSGGGGYYISNNSNQNILSASISGNSLVASGITVGSVNITVCQTGGQCNTLYATVSNSTPATVSSVPVTFSKTSVVVDVRGISNVDISGGSGSGYYISYNSNSNSIGTYITGSSLIVTGKAKGSGTLSICSSGSICGSISVTVNEVVSKTISPSLGNSSFKFTKPLKSGMSGTEVTELQKKLKKEGIYSGPITGYYGNLTVLAVKKFQKIHSLAQLGSVGPSTRIDLNK